MESNQPEPPSSSGSPQQPSSDVGLPSGNQAFCDVNYVNDTSNVDEFHNENFVTQFKTDERLSPVVSYAQFNVDRSDSADSTGTFVQVSIQSYPATVSGSTSHQHYEDPSDTDASQEHHVNDLSVNSKGQMVDSLSVSQSSMVHGNSSEVLVANDESPQVLSLHEESADSHPAQVQEAEAVLGRVSLDQLNLQHISVLHHGIPSLAGILLDRNSIAALMAAPRADASLCLDATGITRSVISSQNLSQRTLLNADQTHFLSADPSLATISHNLLSPMLTQKDILPSIIASSSSSTLNPATISNSYPLTHKQMLVQKYAAELETPTTSASLIAEMRDQQLIESISDRVSSPYVVASSSNALIDSHGMSVYGDHVSMPSTSAGQCLPIEVYSIDRGVALVSSTRDSPDDIMHSDVEFSSVSHSSVTHPTVQNYVSSSVDLVHPHHVDHGMYCAVDSTVGPKLHPSEENMVDSSDTYGDHVDASDNVLHTTSREDYSCHIADMNSCDGVTANNVTSVLNNATVLDANEALSSTTSRIFTTHTQCMYLNQHHNFDRTVQISGSLVHDTTDIQGCSTVSSATYPDSTHSPIGMTDESPDHMVCDIPSDSPEDMVQSENSRPRRDLRTNRHWCDDCSMFYEKDCPHHRIQLIVDKPVLSRAFASLPATYLYVNKIGIDEGGEPVYGVFAKKTIPKRTQFGPVEGVLVKHEDPPSECFILIVEHEDGLPLYLDTSDESMSNWMRFVRPAGMYKDQNLVLVQQGTALFFNTTKSINPKTELRVWYSPTYATKWGLPVLEPDEEEKRMLQEQENAWPCFECNQRFATSDDLQKHLNQHDEENGVLPDLVAMRARHKARIRAKIVKKNPRMKPTYQVTLGSVDEVSTQTLPPSKRARGRPPKRHKIPCKQEDYKCEICLKVFPRNYSLQRHLIMHSGEKKYKCPICDMKFSHVYNRNRHVRRHKQREEGDVINNIPKPKSIFKKKQGAEWVCTHCDLTFDNSNVCNLHTLTHAAEDVGLNEADRFFDKKYGSEDGMEAGSSESSKLGDDELHKCPECTQEFLSKRDLIEHASVHGKVGKSRCYRGGIINPLKPFKCNLCYKSFASDERLIRHYLVHGSEDSKPLQCDICFKRFLNNSALACHVKVHSEEKKFYECPICKEEFDQIVALKDHVHIHCCNGVYNCPHCHKTFEEYNQIRKHIRAFHSERRYPCDKCEKIFPRPDKLKLHMLRHSDHREFLCANCGKQFKRKDKLKEHMKRMHAPEREAKMNAKNAKSAGSKKFIPKVSPTDYHRFIYKCHSCLLGFKRRGMLVNHLAKRHPDIRPESVPELNLPILKTTRDYYCQYCEKVYKSSSKRKAHILKNHPGADLPMSNRRKGGVPEIPGVPNPTFSQTVGSITTHPHHCNWCHKQYASKAKLLQHQRKKHMDMLALSYVAAANAAKVEAVCDQGTQVTGQILIESVTNGISPETAAVLIDATKRKIQYLEREALVAATTHPDGLPTADLLTQAMSELTQNLEYRAAPGEFLTARLTQSVPTIVANSSPSITPSPTPATISTPTSPNISETTNSTPPLDQIQLNQLLAQYQQQTLSQQQLAVVVTSHAWPAAVTATLSNYPAR